MKFVPKPRNQRTVRTAASVAFCTLGLLTFGVNAQPLAPDSVPVSANVNAGQPTPSADAAARDPATAGTPQQLLARGKAALAEIATARTSLTALVAAAKDQRDVVKVLCLDDKSGQVEAALRTTEERVESLALAAKHGADQRARHEYLMVVTLKERVAVLMSEANQCLGEEAGFSGDAVLNVEIDPTLPRVVAEVVPFSPVLFIPVSLNSGVY